ncbi:MAG: TonB-dependent receptor [Xanthomonadales bacterium]|nr:TonB-dependent receptor [Xanthomonadales bacterium]
MYPNATHSAPRSSSQGSLRLRLAISAALLASPFALTGTAVAQDSGDQAEGAYIEEITVTSRRREESLQDVPLSVTAFTGDTLERIGAADLVAVSQTTPNVTLETSRSTNSTLTAFIRGVGQQDPVAGFEAGVGIYIDDVYLNRPQGSLLDIYDVERIEVLRGPQGTLYGRNTIGGAIKYVTRRLGSETEGRARFSLGTDGQVDLVLSASTPVSDTFAVGASIASLNRDGFGENLTLSGVDNYAKDILGFRASAEWTPTSNSFYRIAIDYVDDDSDPRQGHRLTPGNVSGAPVLDNIFDTRAGLNNPAQEVKNMGISILGEWEYSDTITLKNILAYRDNESSSPIDFDSLAAVDLDVPVVYEDDQLSNEFQVLFQGDQWSGIVGAYYLDARGFNAFDVLLFDTGDLIGLPGLNAFSLGDVETDTWSLFADVTYDINDQWALSFGGRYTSDERTSRVLRQTYLGGSAFFGGNGVPIATSSDFLGSEEFTDFTPRLSIAYRPDADNNLYATYSEGFKGGSFDPRGATTAAPDLDGDGDIDDADIFEFMKFEPETVESLEFGWKTTALDGKLRSNLAIFFADYTDVQVPGSIGLDTDGDGVNDTFIGITSNAGEASINGIEWEGQAFLAQDLWTSGDDMSLAWTLGYIDAEYDRFIDAFGQDVADERVFQNTPDLTGSATLTYEWPMDLGGNSGSMALITTVSHRDESSQFEAPNPFLDQDTFTLWDLSLVWEDDAGKWRAGLHGKNLLDEEYKVAGYFFPTLGLESSITAFYGNPRQVTATVEYRF